MRAAIIAGTQKTEIVEAAIPEPSAHEVRVKIEGCGVSLSNIPFWEGRNWFRYPRDAGAPGREAWGRIDAIGREVKDLAPGDRVTMLSYHAFAEYDLARADEVALLPRSLTGKPFPGEALGGAMNIFGRAGVALREHVAVIGVGFLGALLTQLAARAGARVIAISRRSFALDIARKMGAAATIAAGTVAMNDQRRVIEEVVELTQGALCDLVIEATGEQCPLDLAAELTRERGRLLIAGYHQGGPRRINMQLWNWRGLDVINAHERAHRVYVANMREAGDAVAHGRLDPSLLYTHIFNLDQIDHAMNTARARPDGFLKALITMASNQ
jgi:threonine dehydrogenase-like Zn-dependent dehydrogenase